MATLDFVNRGRLGAGRLAVAPVEDHRAASLAWLMKEVCLSNSHRLIGTSAACAEMTP